MTLAWVRDPAWLIIYALAAYRLTRIWTRDSLPFLVQFREYVDRMHASKWWAPLTYCVWCAGWWISLGVALVSSSPLAAAWQWVAVPLALSAVVGVLASHEKRD